MVWNASWTHFRCRRNSSPYGNRLRTFSHPILDTSALATNQSHKERRYKHFKQYKGRSVRIIATPVIHKFMSRIVAVGDDRRSPEELGIYDIACSERIMLDIFGPSLVTWQALPYRFPHSANVRSCPSAGNIWTLPRKGIFRGPGGKRALLRPRATTRR